MNEEVVNVLFIFEVRDELKEYLLTNLSQVKKLTLIFPEKAEEEEYLKHASIIDVIVGWRPAKELLLSAPKLKLFINHLQKMVVLLVVLLLLIMEQEII